MENEPLTAEEDAAIVAVVEDVFGRRFPAQQCVRVPPEVAQPANREN